jgi:hypothetical protein
LHDGYEELRAYALSKIKFPSQPLGLDLWLKKGFLAWAEIMLCRDLPAKSINCAPMRPEKFDLAMALVLSISNILTEWSENNVGFN